MSPMARSISSFLLLLEEHGSAARPRALSHPRAKPCVSELSKASPKLGRSGLKSFRQSWGRGRPWAPQGSGKGDNGANSFHIPQGNLPTLENPIWVP